MTIINQQIVLNKNPSGKMKPSDFKLIETPVPELKKGDVLLKTKYFSIDPYMRARMNNVVSYTESFKLGEVLTGYAICIVKASQNPDLQEGDIVLTNTGWQTYCVLTPKIEKNMSITPSSVTKLMPNVKSSLFLGVLGMPGLAAWYGLNEIGQPKAGETVVVAAATGPVGSMVGQLAKAQGCYVVGIAGGAAKCRYAVTEFGFDACIDHRSKGMAKELKKACPKGIDIYYETVGGKVLSAILPLLNVYSRVAVVGAIAWYDDALTLREKNFNIKNILPIASSFSHLFLHFDQTPIIWLSMIAKRIKFQGFLANDHFDHYAKFLEKTIPLIQSGKIKAKEDIIQGIDQAPQAFIGLLEGKNFGKLIIEIPE